MPLLFSYGTLWDPQVQLDTFGRLLTGEMDELVGFEPSRVKIEDPDLVVASGRTHHANVTFNGKPESRVSGTALEVSDRELAVADGYEHPADYVRVIARLASGKSAWVYLHVSSAREVGHM